MGLVALRHVGSSQTRARTRVPCIGRWILNHCTTREARQLFFLLFKIPCYHGRFPMITVLSFVQFLDSNTNCRDIYEAPHNISGFPPIPSCTPIYSFCISYLLLLDKLTSNFSGLKQHLLSHGFWGSGMQEQFGWSCLRVSHEVAVKQSAWDAVVWSLNRGWKVRFQGGSLMC